MTVKMKKNVIFFNGFIRTTNRHAKYIPIFSWSVDGVPNVVTRNHTFISNRNDPTKIDLLFDATEVWSISKVAINIIHHKALQNAIGRCIKIKIKNPRKPYSIKLSSYTRSKSTADEASSLADIFENIAGKTLENKEMSEELKGNTKMFEI